MPQPPSGQRWPIRLWDAQRARYRAHGVDAGTFLAKGKHLSPVGKFRHIGRATLRGSCSITEGRLTSCSTGPVAGGRRSLAGGAEPVIRSSGVLKATRQMRAILIGTVVFAILYAGYIALLNTAPGTYLVLLYCGIPIVSGAITRRYASRAVFLTLLMTGIAAAICLAALNLAFSRAGWVTDLATFSNWLGGRSVTRLLVPVLLVAGGIIASVARRD